jgi:hypothetical protein
MTQKSQPVDFRVVGYLDSVSMSGDLLRVSGWVADVVPGRRPLEVLLRADDGSEALVTANLPRPDLLAHSISNIMAGFDVTFSVTRSAFSLEALALGEQGWAKFSSCSIDTMKLSPEPTGSDVYMVYRVLFCREPSNEEVEQHLGVFLSVDELIDDLLESNELLRAQGPWVRVLKSLVHSDEVKA